ncbi:ATP-binding cassette sub-family B member 9 [Galemys pyrenaicus]|uniref:ATP-binding cassette sub-family B member 9 n=1 Tax=Galemys pyrenaicus TaxID=202257 RepID=A0A8J6A4A2_GALPY|nr:ATP-binding cassette sub-family B member 9 [Galemys pyrenaicus]
MPGQRSTPGRAVLQSRQLGRNALRAGRMQLWKAVVVTLAFMSVDVGVTTAIYVLSHRDRSLLEDIRHFNVFDSVLDLWAACLYRSCLLLGATIGVAKNSALGPRRLRASWTVIALVCLFVGIYAMVKLLLFSEVRKPVRDPWFWALFVWTYLSLAASFLLWWLLSTVRPGAKALERGAGAEAEAFPTEGQPPPEQASGATLQKLLSYTKPDAAFLVAASFFLIVAALGETFLPYYTGRAIDGIVIQKSMEQFSTAVVVMCLLAVGRLNIRLRNRLFRSLVSQETSFFDENRTGDLISRLTSDTTMVSDLVSQNINIFLRNTVKVTGVVVFMFSLSWQLSLVTFMGFPIIMMVSDVYGKYYKPGVSGAGPPQGLSGPRRPGHDSPVRGVRGLQAGWTLSVMMAAEQAGLRELRNSAGPVGHRPETAAPASQPRRCGQSLASPPPKTCGAPGSVLAVALICASADDHAVPWAAGAWAANSLDQPASSAAVRSTLCGDCLSGSARPQRLSKEVQSALARASSTAEETISALKTVRSFANEEEEAEVYARKLQQVYRLNRKEAAAYTYYVWGSGVRTARGPAGGVEPCGPAPSPLPQLTLLVVQVSILYYGGHLVISGQMTSGNLISFIIYEFVLGDCMESVGSVYSGLMQGVGAAEKVFEFIDRQPTMVHGGSLAPDHLEGRVDFENVTFTYRTRPHTQVLQDVSFSLSPGKVTALVGPSGSGKSSCVNILENFYPLEGGRVLLDGQPIGAYDHKYLHRVISLVSQEPVLFARSITDNISYGLPAVPFEMVVEAAQKANAHGFIMELQDGYNTETGEKGAQLSGGQKQRVALARALVRNPPVLILDEATSALDAESEHLIQQAIHGNLQRHTVLIVAHRLSTVERAHRIVVLDKGRVAQQGTHQQLLAQGGLYARLVQRQVLGLEPASDCAACPREPSGSGGHQA